MDALRLSKSYKKSASRPQKSYKKETRYGCRSRIKKTALGPQKSYKKEGVALTPSLDIFGQFSVFAAALTWARHMMCANTASAPSSSETAMPSTER